MFCCRAASLCDEVFDYERQKKKKMSKAEKQKQKTGGTYTVFRGKNNGHINANILFPVHTYSGKQLKPQVKHVTNVEKDVYVKLSRVSEKNQLPAHLQAQHSKKQMFLPGYRVKSAPYPPVDYKSNGVNSQQNVSPVNNASTNGFHMIKEMGTNYSVTDSGVNGVTDIKAEKNGSVENGVIKENDNVSKWDNDSLTEQQNQALSSLDDTLNSFTCNMDDSDGDDVPTIIADVLPYGEYEPFNINEVNMDSSEKAGTSRTSSISNESSINSRTGIISRRRDADDSSRRTSNSVSFKLPEGHVDKPYSPMQAKPKVHPQYREQGNNGNHGNHSFTTICFSDEKGKLWHTGNGVLVQDNAPKKRFGPFKGSFKGLFYGKYAEKDALINNDRSKAPKVMHTIASFENLSLDGDRIVSKGSITRRNTFQFQ